MYLSKICLLDWVLYQFIEHYPIAQKFFYIYADDNVEIRRRVHFQNMLTYHEPWNYFRFAISRHIFKSFEITNVKRSKQMFAPCIHKNRKEMLVYFWGR